MRRLGLVCVASAIALTVGSSAWALSYTGWLPSPAFSYDALVNWSQNLSVPQFDPSLGTLVEVQWELEGSTHGTATYINYDGTMPAYGTLGSKITLSRPGGGVIGTILPSVLIDLGSPPGSDPDGIVYGPYDLSSPVASANGILTTDLSAFIGMGTVLMPVDAAGTSDGIGSGNSEWSFDTIAGASSRVRYGYDAVPEQSSRGLVLVGMAPLALMWWRRRRPHTHRAA